MLLELGMPSTFLLNLPFQILAEEGGTIGHSHYWSESCHTSIKDYGDWQKLKGGDPNNDKNGIQVNLSESRVQVHLVQ